MKENQKEIRLMKADLGTDKLPAVAINFQVEELPLDYDKNYTLDFIIREKLGESQRRKAMADLCKLLGVSPRMVQFYRRYRIGEKKGKLNDLKIQLIADYFGISKDLVFSPQRIAA